MTSGPEDASGAGRGDGPRFRTAHTSCGLGGIAALALVFVFTGCSPETVNAVTRGGTRVASETRDASGDRIAVPDGSGYRSDGSGIVDPSGNPFRIKAVSWYGLEQDFAPQGLYAQNLDVILGLIASSGFNTVRLTWSSQTLDPTSKPSNINLNVNPDLANVSPLELLDKIVARAGAHDLKIILSRHQSSAGTQDDVWFDAQYPTKRFIDDWVTLASRYANTQTVIGCDLQNDLRGVATWGDGNPSTDWRAAAESAGNAILGVNATVLIFVQGIEKASDGSYYWRGGNLKDAQAHPVNLVHPDRLVYAAQDFPRTALNPPQGMAPPWFSDPSFPENLPTSVWRQYWGYQLDSGPVLLSAFGMGLGQDPTDAPWLNALGQYIDDNPGLSFAYWALNPDENDVKGVLSDWSTVNTDVVNALQPILSR